MANNERFTATIEVNSQQAQSRLRELESDVERLQKEYKRLKAEGTAESKQRAQLLQNEINVKNKLISQERRLINGLNAAMENLSRKTYKELQAQVRALNKLMRDGTVQKGSEEWKALAERVRQCKREMQEYNDAVKEQESAWARFTGFLNKNWGAITQIFGAVTGMSATIRSAVNDYATMEEEMADVRKYTGLTTEQVRDLNEEFKKMDTRTSREQLNQLAGSAGRLGITSKEALLDFVDAADKIGVSLGDDLGDGAVDQIGKLAMAFGEDDRLGLRGAMLATGSAINELAQNSAANAGYLVDFTARVAGAGKQLGLTQAQIMGFGAVMDENLLRDEMASTAFSQMITKMATDTAKFSKFAGMEAEKFAKLVKEDINGAILALADNMRRQDPTNMLKMFGDMGLDGTRAIGVLTNMADKIDDVRRHQETANEAYEKGTSVIEEYNVMNDTAQARIEKVKKAFKEMTVELGERLLPVVKYTISTGAMLAKALSTIAGFVDRHKGTIVVLTSTLLAYVAAQKLQWAWSQRQVAIAKIKTAWQVIEDKWLMASIIKHRVLKGEITATAGAQQMLNTVMKLNPYGAVAAAITALIALYIKFATSTNSAEKAQKRLLEVEEEATKNTREEIIRIERLKRTIEDANVSISNRRAAIEELQQIIPSYHASLTDEGELIGHNTELLDIYIKQLKNTARIQSAASKLPDAEERLRKHMQGASANIQNAYIDQRLNHKSEADAARDNAAGLAAYRAWKAQLKELEEEVEHYNKIIDDYTLANQKLADLSTDTERRETKAGTVNYVTDKELRRQEAEKKKALKEQADAAKANWQEQLATEMLAYRQGLTAYTEYMEKRHSLTQAYYDELKRIYGEDSNEYKKALLQQERDEQEYIQWQMKQADTQLLQEKLRREHAIRMQCAQQGVQDADALNEALFQSDVTYLKQKQNLYKKGAKEWIDIEQQIQQEERKHQYELEQGWMQRLSRYRQEAGLMDYQRLQEIELRGVESFYGALLRSGRMAQDEYDAIVEHIKRKYAEMEASQTAGNSVRHKASSALDTARKATGSEQPSTGNDAATGIYSISQAVNQQRLINEQLKRLYGEDYENNREYQEAKRQLDAETMQAIVAGAQAAYSTIGSLMTATSSYAQACSDLEVAKITANYERQIEAAGSNSKKREKLEKERDKKIAKAKSEANKKAMAIELAQAVASTALAAINAYASAAKLPPPAGQIMPPVMAGLALAAGALQIATIKKQHQAEAAGYYEGGFTGGTRYRKEAGVVHEGEFVANHQAVNNRQLMPVFTLLDQAQRSNRVGSLRAEDVTNVMGGPAAATVVAPVVNVQNDNEELKAGIEELGGVMVTLRERLDEGIEAYAVIDGPNGLYKALKKYERLISKK